MSARAVSKYTQKLTGGVGAVLLRFLGPDDRRIIMFDSDDEWWRVEARRAGHRGRGPLRSPCGSNEPEDMKHSIEHRPIPRAAVLSQPSGFLL